MIGSKLLLRSHKYLSLGHSSASKHGHAFPSDHFCSHGAVDHSGIVVEDFRGLGCRISANGTYFAQNVYHHPRWFFGTVSPTWQHHRQGIARAVCRRSLLAIDCYNGNATLARAFLHVGSDHSHGAAIKIDDLHHELASTIKTLNDIHKWLLVAKCGASLIFRVFELCVDHWQADNSRKARNNSCGHRDDISESAPRKCGRERRPQPIEVRRVKDCQRAHQHANNKGKSTPKNNPIHTRAIIANSCARKFHRKLVGGYIAHNRGSDGCFQLVLA